MQRVKNFFKDYWITIIVVVGIVAAYKYGTDTHRMNSYLFPTIKEIGESFRDNRSLMLLNLVSSFQLMIPTIIISVVIALAAGIVLGMNKKVRKASYPIIYVISVIPAILLSPFALNIAPTFRSASLFICVYCNVWPTMFATITGVMTVDKRYLDNAATLELPKFQKMTKVIIPAAMPSIMSGFITSLRGTFVVLVYAEMYGTQYGMGYFVKRNADHGLFNHTWSGFIFMVAILVLVLTFFEKMKDRMLKWAID